MKRVIALGSDHAGFPLKENIKQYLTKKGFEIKDFGTNNEESVDYPDFAFPVCEFVLKNKPSFGFLICATGIGMSIAANRTPGIRAALCHRPEFAIFARKHNHANVLCLPGRFLKNKEALEIVDAFLKTEEEGGRHKRRVEKLG